MKEQPEVVRYLERYRGRGEADMVINRAGYALLRYNVRTMGQAAEMSDEQIAKMRNVGVKTKAFIRQAVDDYLQEQAGAAPAPTGQPNRKTGTNPQETEGGTK